MCGFCGYINKNNNIENDKCIKDMCNKLNLKDTNTNNVYIDSNIALGYSNSKDTTITVPMIKNINGNEYVLVYNGELYNTKDLREDLISKGYTFTTLSDAEVIITSYKHYKDKCVEFFNGCFSFAIYDKTNQKLFLARDKLGTKPLYFTKTNNTFIFSTKISSILEHPEITPILDKTGIMELIGLGPAHTPGKTFFKNIYEIKPGYVANFSNFNLNEKMYWDLVTKNCTDTEEEAIKHIHDLVVDATKKQLVSNKNVCCMLSGGLDSSILSKISKDNISDLTTFSIDFVDNDTNFVSNDYQGSKDSDYTKIMKEYLNANHKDIVVDNSYLFDVLNESMIARDMPGMADIDSSMYIFCSKITENGFDVCLSGECSDEIFGGYPWYYKEHLINHEGFPWALSENLRNNILKVGILKENELNEYVNNARFDTLKNVVHLDKDDDYQKRFRNTNYLTIKWFMNTLIERTDRMSNATSLNVRIPFADYRIFEYVYNLPARMKLGVSRNNEPVEKYLLRKAFEKELPKDVVYRKKSPFPKTYDPNYLEAVETEMLKILDDKNLKIHKIINGKFVKNLIDTHGNSLKENWFGQLMTYPQTLAYLIQISNWLEYYNIEIEI